MSTSIIILAAGQGKRMNSANPKVLQTLAGRPVLQHVIDISRSLGADDICVVYGYGGDDVRAAFAHEDIRWAVQAEQKGTGHAVQQAMPGTPDENRVLVLYGDGPLLRTTTLQNLLSSCGQDEVALLTVKRDDPFGYGRIVRENGVVMKSVEENDADDKEKTINEINTGVLCCSADRLKPWLENLSNDNSQGEYYLTDVVGMAVADGIAVNGVTTDDQVETMGINDRRQLAEAERALQRRLVDQLMEDGVTFADPDRVDIRGKLTCGRDVFIDVNSIFEGDVHLGDNVKVESNNVIRDCRIGSGSVVHSNCHFDNAKMGRDCEIGPFARLRPGANLADNVHIGNFVEIKKSTVADNTKINHLSYIGDSTVGTNVNIGAGTICCNYDGAHKHQTIIGDGAFVGSGVELVAPVEIGKGATIGAGSTISKPAPAGKLTLERTRQVTLASWKAPAKNK